MTENNEHKHVVFYSGGLGSFATTLRVIEKHGKENLTLLFTDTLIEDSDLYRFIIETAGHFFKIDKNKINNLVEDTLNISLTEENQEQRKLDLEQLRLKSNEIIPQMVWLTEHKDPWDIFFEQKFLGNSRIAQCSYILKQLMSKKYVKKHFNPDKTTLLFDNNIIFTSNLDHLTLLLSLLCCIFLILWCFIYNLLNPPKNSCLIDNSLIISGSTPSSTMKPLVLSLTPFTCSKLT